LIGTNAQAYFDLEQKKKKNLNNIDT
jgi:hypothetical protein